MDAARPRPLKAAGAREFPAIMVKDLRRG